MNYYDAIVAGIPLAFLGAASTAFVATGSANVGVAFGGLASLPIIAHGMFVQPPTRD